VSAARTRAALVTGGSSGIGLALALALAEDGYGVTVAGRDAGRLAAAADAARARGLELLPVPADVSREDDVRALVAAHCERHGRLDVLVNSAGGGGGGTGVDALPTELLDTNLAVNLRAPFLTTRECLPLLLTAGAEHGKALLVNVSSVAARLGPPTMSAYAAAKAGVLSLTASTRAQVRGRGVQVTALVPGFTATPMTAWTEGLGLPPGDLIQPSDLVLALRFLLATSASCEVPEIDFASPAADAFLAGAAFREAGGFGAAG
jgi:NAD(P)-dependent dehydrogenase (short-subunit alcohol dehydrogenase family)